MKGTLMKLKIVIAAGGALVIGLMMGRGCSPAPLDPGTAPGVQTPGKEEAWTCSMHPQIRLPNPGKCPICEMPLIAAASAQTSLGGEPMLQLSEHALAMASVETTPVTRRELFRELRAFGKIQYNEAALATITARIDGYAERLLVDFTGIEINAGAPLLEVYSPALLAAQQELLSALQSDAGGPGKSLAELAKVKLQRWGLTQDQIAVLIEKNTLADRITLYSPIQGTVIEKSIIKNSAFKAGEALYRIANLDTVWVYLDIYESDLPWIRLGQPVEITTEAIPGRVFAGQVTFVQPIVSEDTRTIRIPVHVENKDHALKPGMFASAVIRSILAGTGPSAPTGGADQYFCTMKCEREKTYAQPGSCPVCNMKLEPVQAATAETGKGLLAVPASAVLDSGTRRLVYIEKARGLFEARDVVLGPRTAGFFPVLSGLAEGERVATRGGFLIDSQFQITGHPSLFYPGGLMGDATHTNTHQVTPK